MIHAQMIPLSPTAPGSARRSFDRYQTQIEASLLDDLRLLASEVVANAVQHSGQPEGDPITLATRLSDEAIRVEVTDQGTGRQDLRPRSMQPPSGLGFVHLLTDRWSSTPVESFQVWFEIDITTNGLTKRRTPVDQSSWPSSSKPE